LLAVVAVALFQMFKFLREEVVPQEKSLLHDVVLEVKGTSLRLKHHRLFLCRATYFRTLFEDRGKWKDSTTPELPFEFFQDDLMKPEDVQLFFELFYEELPHYARHEKIGEFEEKEGKRRFFALHYLAFITLFDSLREYLEVEMLLKTRWFSEARELIGYVAVTDISGPLRTRAEQWMKLGLFDLSAVPEAFWKVPTSKQLDFLGDPLRSKNDQWVTVDTESLHSTEVAPMKWARMEWRRMNSDRESRRGDYLINDARWQVEWTVENHLRVYCRPMSREGEARKYNIVAHFYAVLLDRTVRLVNALTSLTSSAIDSEAKCLDHPFEQDGWSGAFQDGTDVIIGCVLMLQFRR
jgi:hypothetical protein